MKYRIIGGNFPLLECSLSNGESVRCEAGAMTYMMPTLEMQTSSGGIGQMFSRAFSGEKLFQNRYVAHADNSMIAFSTKVPGEILAMNITPQKGLIIQKSAFLASTEHVERTIHFEQRLGVGFFGGEGFIMQKISGQGTVFLEIDGSLVEKELAPGEVLLVDTGNVAALEESVQMSIERIQGVKNMFLGGEGLFNTRLTGPGKVWIQSMPISALASAVSSVIPRS